MNILWFVIGALAHHFGSKLYRYAKTTSKEVKEARFKYLVSRIYGEVKGQVDEYLESKEEKFKGRR